MKRKVFSHHLKTVSDSGVWTSRRNLMCEWCSHYQVDSVHCPVPISPKVLCGGHYSIPQPRSVYESLSRHTDNLALMWISELIDF